MQMQKMEGISYGHRGFIFAQNNLPNDGKPFGNCNYRREGVSPVGRATESAHPDLGISYGHRRFIFAQKNLHDDGAPFGFILMDSVYNNHGLLDVFIQNENNFLQLNNTIQVACEDIGTSAISGRKRKKKSKETDTSLSDKNRRFAYLKKIDTKAMQLPTQPPCVHCGAIRFYKESASFCCRSGQISLQLPKMHPLLWDLYTNQSCPHAKHFRTRCRSYNNSFAFTSLGMTCDKDLCKKNKGVYTVRVQGTIAHYIDELVPNDGSAKCLQLYFYGADNEVGNRMATFDDLDEDVIRIIMDILTVNPYAVFFRNLRELPNIDNALFVLRADPNLDQRVYNLPLVDHIAAIWEEPFSIEDYNVRDIRVYTKCQESRSIHYYYGCYDPLQYPLLFPFGEPGWHVGIKRLDPSGSIGINGNRIYCLGQHQIQANFYTSGETFLNDEHQNMERNKKKHHNVSAREYSCYLFQVRISDKTNILQTGRLAQQFIIDSYVKLETQRLDFLRDQQRQKEARVETLQGIKDSIAHEVSSSGRDIGRRVMLPASFQGGPRNLRCRYMNALALFQKYGKPGFFITMTCNPKWKEIQDQLLPFEEAQNRPDLLIRVFHAKNEVLKQELTQKQIFGDVAAYFYVIEFQKRGLPHAHWLIILERKYKLTSAEAYDTFVSAEIPDPQASQHLHNCVVQHMMHGPCGELNDKNVCMRDQKCKNKYPKDFCESTLHKPNSYPIYRR
ncbi:hypothetical protein OROHE_008266 [Orobanche hederae]